MKVVMKPVDMVAWFTKEGIPHPIRYRVGEDDKAQIIKVDHILSRTEEKIVGNKMLVFRCQGMVNNILKDFELKYELQTCRWFLYKI